MSLNRLHAIESAHGVSSFRAALSFLRNALPLFLLCLLMGAGARGFAQTDSSIVGVVSDSTGAVVSDAQVTITGAALIGAPRATKTDSGGRYRVGELRPGVYTVTFTAPGFSILKHDQIELTAAFTQTVDGSLALGANTDTVTVSLQAPLVDVQDSVTEQVIDRKALDTVPTGHDIFGVGQLIAGVTTSTPDVGGTTGMQQATLQVHGSSGNDNIFLVDGMWIQHTGFSGNQTGAYYNDSNMENIVYTTDTLPAEAPVGGIQINMIPREGGNQFHGSVFGTGANQFLSSGNLTSALVQQGFTAPNRIDTVYDINPGLGGPILKDRLWFYGSFRRWGANNFLGNTFTPTGAQAKDDNRLTDAALRLTGQITKNQRLTVSYDRGWKFRGHRPNNYLSANFNDPLADVVQKTWLNYIAQAKWMWTPTPKLAWEIGATFMPVNYNLGFEPGVAPGTVAAYDQSTSTITKASPRVDNDRGTFRSYETAVSYVSGRHNLKTGLQMRTGSWQEAFAINNNMLQVLSNGVPNSIRLFNTPLAHRETMPVDLGWFVQDTWKLSKRVTLNPGLRFQHTNMSIPQQSSPVSQWTVPITVNGQQYGTYQTAQNGYVLWNTWSPRLGVTWDVFGDSKTAVRGGVSKYDRLEGTTLVQNINQNFLAYRLCPWSTAAFTALGLNMDPNILPTSYAQIPTGIQAQCTAFTNNGAHLDPNIKRPYQMEYTAMVQHQFGSNTSASLAYYHRNFYDLYGIVNQNLPSTAYAPVTITNPLNGQPLTVYNQTLPANTPAALIQKTLPNLYQHYNGVEFTANTRFKHGSVFGSFTWGRSFGTFDGSTAPTSTYDFNNPNSLINLAGNLGYDAPYQIRVGGNYSLWHKIQVSGTLRSNSGLPQTRTYTLTTSIVPGLTQVTQNVYAASPGTYRYPYQNLVDLRVSKAWTIRDRVTFEPVADLFNVFNTNAVTSANTTIGSTLLKPSAIDFGRMARLGGKVTF